MMNGDFYWFFGEVVDINDPENKGRVRVKAFTQQNNTKEKVDDVDLNWALVAQSLISAAKKGDSIGPHGLQKGSQVFGFYVDGKMMQVPFVICSFNTSTENTIDLHELTRGVNKFNDASIEFEPKNPYAAKYPYNKVYASATGHIIEIDDTPNAERIHIRHKSGSYYHFFPDGSVVRRSNKNGVDLVIGNSSIYVGGNVTEHIKGDYTLNIDGKYNVQANMINMTSNTSITYSANSSITSNAKYAINLNGGSLIKQQASIIALN